MKPLTWIIAEAKKLKKQYPKRYSKWTDYVKQASALYSSKHASKSPVAKKKVSGVDKYIVIKDNKYLTGSGGSYKFIDNKEFSYVFDDIKKANKLASIYNGKVIKWLSIGYIKKKPVKKNLVKKTATKLHKDTKSHNVNIKVMSGISKGQFNMLNTWQNIYGKLAKDYISSTNIKEKQKIKKEMYTVKLILNDIKKIKSI